MATQEFCQVCSDEAIPPLPRQLGSNRRGLIGVVLVSNSTVSFTIYGTPEFKEVHTVSEEIQLFMPQDGWFELDPKEVINAVYQCCSEGSACLPSKGFRQEDLICVGITTQRGTTIVWNAITGQAFYRAITWNDMRTVDMTVEFMSKMSEKKLKELQKLSGLQITPYIAAFRLQWLKKNVPSVNEAMKRGCCLAGTLDTWIVWNLTRGRLHITDVTNAAQTMLMNIKTLSWDPVLLKVFDVNVDILPRIRSCSEIYGRITAHRSALKQVYICSIIGDQQGSLVGQMCLERGQVNCNYDYECNVLYNTGGQRLLSVQGLQTTVAFKMGPNAQPIYALEGGCAVGMRTFNWFTNKMRLIPETAVAENYARSVESTYGLYFVPALTGLQSPHWQRDARGLIVGLRRSHTTKHIVRAIHEAICYHVCDIIDRMRVESGVKVNKLYADGELTKNKTLMQMQADIAGITVVVSKRFDRMKLGAAFCAAHAYSYDLSNIKPGCPPNGHDTYLPALCPDVREIRYNRWKEAVKCSMNWAGFREPQKKSKLPKLIFPILVIFLALSVYTYLQLFDEEFEECPPQQNRRR